MDTDRVANLAHCDRLLTSLTRQRANYRAAGWHRALTDADFLLDSLLDRRLHLMRALA